MKTKLTEHYHGDSVRILFVLAGVIIIVSYPFFTDLVGLPLPITAVAVIALAVFGGLINPRHIWTIALNAIIPLLALFVFEHMASYSYANLTLDTPVHFWFFWVNQALAVIFFIATYLAFKTLRGAIIASRANPFQE